MDLSESLEKQIEIYLYKKKKRKQYSFTQLGKQYGISRQRAQRIYDYIDQQVKSGYLQIKKVK